MSKFYIASTSASATSTPAYEQSVSSDVDDDDLDNLPYPGELPRSDFLAPDFDAQTYLSTLRNRHQTLEDLRSDLRQRSQLLNQELLDLVNSNYEEFLSLGGDLQGGEDKIEGVRLGLLGFQREIEGIKRGVKDRSDEVQGLVRERKAIRRDVVLGRNLLELAERVTELERRLGIANTVNEDDFIDDEEDDDEDSSPIIAQVKRLQINVQHHSRVSNTVQRLGSDHPFVVSMEPRLIELRKTILLDLSAALRNAKTAKNNDAVVTLVGLFEDLDAEADCIRVLKGG